MKSCVRNLKAVIAILVFAVAAEESGAQCTRPSCFEKTKFLEGMVAIELSGDPSNADIHGAANAIRARGGAVALAGDQVLIGWLPQKQDASLVGRHKIAKIFRETPAASQGFRRSSDRLVLDFYNAVVSGRLASQLDNTADDVGAPLTGDVVYPPTLPPTSNVAAAPTGASKPRSLQPRADAVGPPWGPPYESMNTRMLGWVSVTLFLVESTGPNSVYDWTSAQMDAILNPLLFSLSWWADQARTWGLTLSFRVGAIGPWNQSAQISYEPIRNTSFDEYLWINEVMTDLNSTTNPGDEAYKRPGGFGATSHFGPFINTNDVQLAVQDYNQFVAQIEGSNWAFCTFVVNNSSAEPNFSNGPPQGVSHAILGGPWSTVLYYSGGWPIETVMRHETGHIFWACDEHATPGAGCTTCSYCWNVGPAVGTDNANCSISGCSLNQSCMMRSNAHILCSSTRRQIGWWGR